MSVKTKQRDPIIDQLLKEITLMRNQIQILGGSNNRLNEQTTQSDLINPKTGQSWKMYCWSCGCCVHWGKNCPNKKKGHKVEATFRNRMNGSSTNCLWLFRGATQFRRNKMVNYLTKYVINNILSRVVSSDNLEYMKADSGATKTYLKKKHQKYLQNLIRLSNGPLAVLPKIWVIYLYIRCWTIQHWCSQL